MSNRNKCAKSALQVGNTQNVSLQVKFGKKSVANFSRGCAFLLLQRKIRCVVISFSGSAEVAAGLSNPPTLRGVWGGVGEIRAVDKGLREYRGPGAGGWVGGTSSHAAATGIVVFMKGK